MTSAAKERSNRLIAELGAAFLSTGDAAPLFVRRTALVDEVVLKTCASTLGATSAAASAARGALIAFELTRIPTLSP